MTSESIDLNCVAAPDLGRVVGVILGALATLVFRAFSRDPRRVALHAALATFIRRTARRFDRLMARLAAGKLAKPRPARPRPAKPEAAPDAEPKSRPPRIRFPRRRGWIVEDLKHYAAVRAHQVEYLLNQPDHAARVASCPQAHRLLRPLCHMLGIAPACIPPLPRRPRKPRPRPAPKPARLTRKQLEALLWYPNIEGRPMRLIPPRKFRT
jgi:hypothetical protein